MNDYQNNVSFFSLRGTVRTQVSRTFFLEIGIAPVDFGVLPVARGNSPGIPVM